MMGRLAHAVIRLSARLVRRDLRNRWCEEWLAELDAVPGGRSRLAFVAGAPWDAISSRWTTRGRVGPRIWPTAREWRQAARSLRRAPWFACSSAAVIALSMALTTTVVAVVDGVLFKSLPYPQPDRLFIVIENAWPGNGRPEKAGASPVQLATWQDALPDAQVATYFGTPRPTFLLKQGARAERLAHVMVGEGFWETLGVVPMFGQFTADDFMTELDVESAIISHELWTRWCNADPAAIGRAIVDSDGSGIRVAGVLPSDFVPPWGFHADVITPYVNRLNDYDRRGSAVLVRASAATTAEQIASRLSALNAALATDWPLSSSTNESRQHRRMPIGDVSLTPLREVLTGQTRATSWLVLAMAVCLMAVGCLNVSGLAAARVDDRWHDLVLRRSLGARSLDLARLVAAESAIVVGVGAAAGVAIAGPLLRLTVGLMADPTQLLKVPAIDARVLVFSALAGACSVALITLGAGRRLSAVNVRATLADGTTTSRRSRRATWSLVSAQVAVACVLTVGGALVAASFVRVSQEDPGLDLTRTAQVNVTPPRDPSASEIEQLVGSLRLLPGVEMAGGTSGDMLSGTEFSGSDFDAPPHVPSAPENSGVGPGVFGVKLLSRRITAGYLDTAGLAPIEGRLPTREEFERGTPVLVVSEIVARGYWPGGPAVGQTLTSTESSGQRRIFTVVGVVPDARYTALDREAIGAIYYPNMASAEPWLGSVLVRLDADQPASLQHVARWLRERCPRCTVWDRPAMLQDLVSASIRPRTFNAWLFGGFGVAALVIVGAGILGLVTMTAVRRTKEIGVRLALGATPVRITAQMIREQGGPVLAGLAAGGVFAAWAVRFVESYLYELPVYDPATWAAALGALLAVAIVGALVPSVRASRLDPAQALRTE